MKKILFVVLCVLMSVLVFGIISGGEIDGKALAAGIPLGLVFSALTVTTYQTKVGSGYRETQKVQHDIDASMTLTEFYLGALISNYGATGAITLKLPSAKLGKVISFIRLTDQTLNIDPQDTEYIVDPGTGSVLAAGEVLVISHLYDEVTLRCTRTGYWTPIVYVSPAENREGAIWVASSIGAKTDDYQILSTDDGKCFTNTGAAKDIVLTLPVGVAGMVYEAAVTESGWAITVQSYASEFVKNPITGSFQSASQYLKADRKGSHIRVVCLVTGYWYIEIIEGQWLPEETYVVSKTANYSLLASDSGGVFDNTGDAGELIFTLPAGLPGMEYTVLVEAAYNVKIDTPGTDYIQNPITGAWQALGKYISSSVLGSRIKVVCDIAGYWHLEDVVGPWIAEDSLLNTGTDALDLEITDNGKTYTNSGAIGAITLNLPAAVVGLNFNFFVLAAQELRMDPDGTETCALPSTGVQGAAGKYLTANAIGEWCNLVCLIAGQWECRGYAGTWGAEG